MSTYENASRSTAYREALILIANRHDLLVYFDFGIDFNVLPFRFILDECEIMRGSLDLLRKFHITISNCWKKISRMELKRLGTGRLVRKERLK